jgi:hypothetical protein
MAYDKFNLTAENNPSRWPYGSIFELVTTQINFGYEEYKTFKQYMQKTIFMA